MRCLFTKKINLNTTPNSKEIEVDFVDVINIELIDFETIEIHDQVLIFTSINGAKSFINNINNINFDSIPNIFCVGDRAASLLKDNGFNIVVIAKNAEELSKILIDDYHNNRYLHFCGDIALETIGNQLNKNNIPYQKIISYKTELIYPKVDKNHDAVVFFSPSGVRSFVKHNTLENYIIFSIGETTTKEIKNWTNNNIITSPYNTTENLLMLISQYNQQ